MQFCPRCLSVPNTTIHVLRDCPFTVSVWNRLLISWPGTYNAMDIVSWLGYLCHATNGDGLVLILTAIWPIWWARNWHYHEGFGSTPTELVYFIRFYLGGLSVL